MASVFEAVPCQARGPKGHTSCSYARAKRRSLEEWHVHCPPTVPVRPDSRHEVCADPRDSAVWTIREGVMEKTCARLCALLRDEKGQDLIEYALIASLLVIAMIVVVGDAGTEVTRLWTSIASGIPDIP